MSTNTDILVTTEAQFIVAGDQIRDSFGDATVLDVAIHPDEVAPRIAVVYLRHGGANGRTLLDPTDCLVRVLPERSFR